MSITDELRDCIRTANRSYEDVRNPYNDREILYIPEEELLAIADRIDAEHKAKVDEAYENGKRDECADWLDETDGGYIKLPVDADGVPIHVGDELTDEKDRPVKVRVLKLRENGWLFDSSRDGGGMLTTLFHHVKPDSWERIIEDAQEYVTDDEPLYSVSELVERCKRLAGEA